MTWNTDLRGSNVALIGYTNGDGVFFLEAQSEYRPDMKLQRNNISTKFATERAACSHSIYHTFLTYYAY